MPSNQHKSALGLDKTLVLVGLMGAGKSTVGRRLATRLGVEFVDLDTEIEVAAGRSITEIFAEYGEAHFRAGEVKVIARLLTSAPCILATGGGAFISEDIRKMVSKSAISIWLHADLETLWNRVSGKSGRPLLQQKDPRNVLKSLMDTRYPIYQTADIMVSSLPGEAHENMVDKILDGLANYRK